MRRVRTPKLLIHNFKQHRRNVFPTCRYTSRKNRTKQEFLDAPLYQILAKRLGVAQPRISDVMRGRIDLVSADMLIDLLAELGVAVHVRTRKIQQSSSQQLLNAPRKLSPPTNSRPAANTVGKRKKTVSPRAQTNTARAFSRNKRREALEDARDVAEARARSAKPVGKPIPLRVVAAKLGVKLGKTGRRVGKAR